MLNWDDPLSIPAKKTEPSMPPVSSGGAVTPRLGDGLQDNAMLMATAGAAPAVNPDPTAGQAGNLHPAANPLRGGNVGFEDLEMGAERIRVDDKQIINCRADLNQLVPFKYDWA